MNGGFYNRVAEGGHTELGSPWSHEADHCEE